MTAITAAAVVAAVVLAGLYLRHRGKSEPAGGVAASDPSVRAPAQGGAPAGSGTPGATSSVECSPGQTGPLRQDSQFTASDGAGTAVRFSISLPDDYYSACKSYPVLYALHGRDQNNVSFLPEAMTMRRAMAAGVLDQSIIVTPDSYVRGRWENGDAGPAEDNFIRYLIPHIEQNYRVEPGPSDRLLVGFSMGGHGALRFGLKYPQLFAAVWSVDGAMGGPEYYLPFVQGKTSADFRITAVGGPTNGDRVKTVVEALKEHGIDVPYRFRDLEHAFTAFVDQDEKDGWYAMRFLQQGLRRPVATRS